MITLAIDTSTARGSVALAGEERTFDRGDLFASIPPGRFDEIVVGVGPGSFTGIRAGIAAAMGLALPGGLPVRAANSFDAIALTALPMLPRDCPQLCVLADARRDEVYFAMYDRQGRCTQPCRLGVLEEIEVHNPIWFVSPEIERFRLREIFGGFASVCATPVFPRAALLEATNLPLEPIYLRPTDYKKV